MNVLVTGSEGFLGPYLIEAFSKEAHTIGIGRETCDLTNERGVYNLFRGMRPDIIVHAAAMTDVDECGLHPHKAVVANAGMTENLVSHMPKNCRFVYISSDMIYSGAGPHREHSKSENPLNMYGVSKYMGEFAAAKAKNHIIVRSNMYGKAKTERKSSLVDFFLDHMKSGEIYNTFTDVFFNPLWTRTLAASLVKMANSQKTGVYNLGAATSMSKAKFAMLLADGMQLSAQGMRPVASEDLARRVVRPLDTRMDITRAENAFSLGLPSLENDLLAMCKDLQCTG